MTYTELVALTDTTEAMVTARKKKMDEFNSGNEILEKSEWVDRHTDQRVELREMWLKKAVYRKGELRLVGQG